ARLREGLIDRANTASSVWADTAYRSHANETFLARAGKTSQIPRRKPKDKPMPKRYAQANAKKSRVRARVQHLFAHQKDRMNLMVRSIGIKRAEATIIMANIAYNLGRWRWWHGRTVSV
ncbi:MAG: transposase, partial [Pseudomonadota bacterium]